MQFEVSWLETASLRTRRNDADLCAGVYKKSKMIGFIVDVQQATDGTASDSCRHYWLAR